MSAVGTSIFTDPDEYAAGFRGAKINLVFAGEGDFKARLTWVELPNLHIQRSQENQSRIACLSLAPKRAVVSFATHFGPPPTYAGVELQPGDIVFHAPGERLHQRTAGPCQWTFISLAPQLLAKHVKVLTGLDLVPPSVGRILRPPPAATAQLRRSHARVCRSAETCPNIIGQDEVARALEHDVLHTLVTCLTADDVHDGDAVNERHANVVIRLEEVLSAQPDRQLHMPDLCAAVGVPERTLRICCTEILGMGPSRYVRLRRLNLVRYALRHADSSARIAGMALRHGFSELGRFAVDYRKVFGETPSATLRASTFKAV